MNNKVWIEDVTGRDGLQNEPNPVSTEQKLVMIRKIAAAGLTRIQATSFVHPRWVPQLADAEELSRHLFEIPGVTFSALIANLKGYERAIAAGFRHLEFVIAASDTFNHRNLNRSTKESLVLLSQVTQRALQDGVVLRVGFSNAYHCPFEGTISATALVAVTRSAREIHPWPISFGDTDGMAFPIQVREAVTLLQQEVMPNLNGLGLHFHDTYGRGLANVLAGLELGVRNFDSTTGGLGGCPYCPGASGNLATEDLVAFLHGMGYETGVDMEKLLDAAELAITFSSRPYQGRLLKAMRPNTPNAVRSASK
jgi:hydroxymethylglutaryl-CoA lyase